MAIICPACEHINPGSPEECESCGEPLPMSADSTIILPPEPVSAPSKGKLQWQSAAVGESRIVRAHIEHSVQDIHLPTDGPVTLGRYDRASDEVPDVDLNTYGAMSKGVSRVHAMLRLAGDLVQVQDLGSTNGTYLNEQMVSSSEWRIVRQGDELRLGNLVMKIYFSDEEKW